LAKIPLNTDILVTHCPPFGVMDEVKTGRYEVKNVGSPALALQDSIIRPLFHIFGHTHYGYGQEHARDLENMAHLRGPLFINASFVNEDYDPVNKRVRIQL